MIATIILPLLCGVRVSIGLTVRALLTNDTRQALTSRQSTDSKVEPMLASRRGGTTDAEITSPLPSAEDPEPSKVPSCKPGAGQNIA